MAAHGYVGWIIFQHPSFNNYSLHFWALDLCQGYKSKDQKLEGVAKEQQFLVLFLRLWFTNFLLALPTPFPFCCGCFIGIIKCFLERLLHFILDNNLTYTPIVKKKILPYYFWPSMLFKKKLHFWREGLLFIFIVLTYYSKK